MRDTSLPETIGNDDYTFNPLDKTEMAQLIEIFWSDAQFRIDNVKHTATMRDRLIHTDAVGKLKSCYTSL